LGDASVVWICPPCIAKGVTMADLLSRKQKQALMPLEPLIFLTEEQLGRDAEAQALNGHVIAVNKDQLVGGVKTKVRVEGMLEYVGRDGQRNPRYFIAKYTDGTVEKLTLAMAKRRLVHKDVVAVSSSPVIVGPGNLTQWVKEYERVTGLQVQGVFVNWHLDMLRNNNTKFSMEDCAQLRCMIDFSHIYTIQDTLDTCDLMWPLFTQGSIAHFVVKGMFPEHMILAPSFQPWLRERMISDLIILQGDAQVMQYLLPLVATACGTAVVARVPERVIYQPTLIMASWLNKEFEAGTLSIVNAPCCAGWLWVIFAKMPGVVINCNEDTCTPPLTHVFRV
jgi:hypothetical protein